MKQSMIRQTDNCRLLKRLFWHCGLHSSGSRWSTPHKHPLVLGWMVISWQTLHGAVWSISACSGTKHFCIWMTMEAKQGHGHSVAQADAERTRSHYRTHTHAHGPFREALRDWGFTPFVSSFTQQKHTKTSPTEMWEACVCVCVCVCVWVCVCTTVPVVCQMCCVSCGFRVNRCIWDDSRCVYKDMNIWNKGLIRKHIHWKSPIGFGLFGKKLYSDREGWVMLILIPNRVHLHAYSDQDCLFWGKITLTAHVCHSCPPPPFSCNAGALCITEPVAWSQRTVETPVGFSPPGTAPFFKRAEFKLQGKVPKCNV